MMSPDAILELIARYPAVPVFYHNDPAHSKNMVLACYEGGLRAFEFTNRGANALAVFRELVPFVAEHCPGMALGIGTILTREEALDFIEAGAHFVVQPVIHAEVGALCQERDVLWVPAGATLNEILQAIRLGARLVKVFPGNVVGPGFVKAVKGPLPWLNLMVTGGVEPTPESVETWLSAGATAVGLGSQLFQNANPATVRERVARLLHESVRLTQLSS